MGGSNKACPLFFRSAWANSVAFATLMVAMMLGQKKVTT